MRNVISSFLLIANAPTSKSRIHGEFQSKRPSANGGCFGPNCKSSTQTFYGFRRSGGGGNAQATSSTLITIDKSNGQLLETIGDTTVGPVISAATDPATSQVFSTHGGGGCCPVAGFTGCIMTSDLNDGRTSVVGCDQELANGSTPTRALSFDSKGNLFAMVRDELVMIDKASGNVTEVINSNTACDGGANIAFGKNDVLYGFCNGDNTLVVFNTTDGTITDLGRPTYIDFPPDPNRDLFDAVDMAYDFQDDVMYGAWGGNVAIQLLVTMDFENLEVTFVGPLPAWTVGLTFVDENDNNDKKTFFN